MSRIGKRPVRIPDGVTLEIKGGMAHVKGTKGELSLPVLPYCSVEIKEAEGKKEAQVTISDPGRQAQANWGTMASLLKNAFLGVTQGFEKKLQFEGIGYRATVEGEKIVLALGFSHPINFPVPKGITAVMTKNIMSISGINKELVGKIAAEIRKLKKPEPYQGKGIRYVGEIVRRKAGKKAAAAGAKA